MKVASSFLRPLSSHLNFMEVKSWHCYSKHEICHKPQWSQDFSLGSSEKERDVSQSLLPISSVRPAGMTYLSLSLPSKGCLSSKCLSCESQYPQKSCDFTALHKAFRPV